jgi:GAF domain-containing protein
MLAPTLPTDENERLAALRSLAILDTPADERFDRITHIAQRLFDVPIVLVSLVDECRQWFKSAQGLSASETPRDISFCGHAIHAGKVFVVENALSDSRFADNPLVTGPPDIRFYAGAPLATTGGFRVGTLCLIDSKPRVFPEADQQMLRDLARWVEEELGRHNAELLSCAAYSIPSSMASSPSTNAAPSKASIRQRYAFLATPRKRSSATTSKN